MKIAETLVQFISDELLEIEDIIDTEENLLSDDMIDSLGMLRLIGFIEASYQIKVPPQEITIANFRTVSILSKFLEELVGASER